MTAYIKTSGAWNMAHDLHVDTGSSFLRVQEAYVASGGVWKKFYDYVEKVTTTTSVTVDNTSPRARLDTVSVSGRVASSTGGAAPAGGSVLITTGVTTLATATIGVNGAFSSSFVPTRTGSMTVVAKYQGQGVHQPSQSAPSAPLIVRADTSFTVVSYPPTAVVGSQFQVSGTVLANADDSANVGSVELTSGTTRRGTSTVNSSGGFTVQMTVLNSDRAVTSLGLKYLGGGAFNPSSSVVPTNFHQPPPPTPSQSLVSVTNTNCVIRVTDLANITHFTMTCPQTGATQTRPTTGVAGTSLDFNWSYGQDATWEFNLTAHSDHPTTKTAVGNKITINTGHAAVTDSGSSTFSFGSTGGTGSWRSADGWANLGDIIAQGYYTSSLGAYIGVGSFDSASLRSQIDNHGTPRSGRWNNVSCSKLEVFANRLSGAGASAAVPIYWYLSTATPGVGGQPSVYFGAKAASPSGVATGSSAWLTLPSDAHSWANHLLAGTYHSLAMTHNGSAYYSQYKGGSSFAVRMTLGWNWAAIPYKAPTWSQ